MVTVVMSSFLFFVLSISKHLVGTTPPPSGMEVCDVKNKEAKLQIIVIYISDFFGRNNLYAQLKV